jgi:hypothetical protein
MFLMHQLLMGLSDQSVLLLRHNHFAQLLLLHLLVL